MYKIHQKCAENSLLKSIYKIILVNKIYYKKWYEKRNTKNELFLNAVLPRRHNRPRARDLIINNLPFYVNIDWLDN